MPTCSLGHALTCTARPTHDATSVTCATCQISIDPELPRFSCSICAYAACILCITKAKRTLEAMKSEASSVAVRVHTLKRAREDESVKRELQRPISSHEVVAPEAEREREKHVSAFVPNVTHPVPPTCPSGHELAGCCNHDNRDDLQCDSCGGFLGGGVASNFFSCATCDYDLCASCAERDQLEGRAPPMCFTSAAPASEAAASASEAAASASGAAASASGAAASASARADADPASASTCPACLGRHRPHTCRKGGKGIGSKTQQARSQDTEDAFLRACRLPAPSRRAHTPVVQTRGG